MKGKRLLRDKYRRDFNDFDVLLRQNVPSKYAQYFTADDDDDSDIEIGRSSPSKTSYKLSPVKKKATLPNVSFKDSENIRLDPTEAFDKDRRRYLDDHDVTDSLIDRTYKYIDSNLNGNNELNDMVTELAGQLYNLRIENAKLKKEGENVEYGDEGNSLLDLYRRKLLKQHGDKIELKKKIEKLEEEVRNREVKELPNSKVSSKEEISSEFEDDDDDDDPEIEKIDLEIEKLQKRRRQILRSKKLARKEASRAAAAAAGMPVININLPSNMSSSIASKVIEGISAGSKSVPINITAPDTAPATVPTPPVTAQQRHINLGENCPLCEQLSSSRHQTQGNDVIQAIIDSAKLSSSEKHALIDKLTGQSRAVPSSSGVW
ncbi:DEKNAAC101008 [Brettanomyces naardenensis]|uniref:DEKNAAC101008 n=1 Tax=Brettanomyces naardenensis TaxID=13370 RepID=A0A448YH26_BRENA|nr:DEKNAAC101008 [Brettanomyces naardenensis]